MRPLAALLTLLIAAAPGTLSAAGSDDKVAPTTNEDTGDVGVRVVSGVVYTPGGGSGPKCSWNRYDQGDWEAAIGTPPPPPRDYDIPDEELTPEELAARNAEREQDARREIQRRSRT